MDPAKQAEIGLKQRTGDHSIAALLASRACPDSTAGGAGVWIAIVWFVAGCATPLSKQMMDPKWEYQASRKAEKSKLQAATSDSRQVATWDTGGNKKDTPPRSGARTVAQWDAHGNITEPMPAKESSWDNLDIGSELRRPGVRLVVVEFYADWCIPCKKAVPQWSTLHESYRDRGLRLLVVSVGQGGVCSNPGWQPDKVICDFDGELQIAFGVETLPQAFLYSWQGNLLVKNGHLDQVQMGIDTYYKATPRILVGEPRDKDGENLPDGSVLREIVRTDLRRLAKFEMVASDEDLESLRRLRKKGYQLNYDNEGRCRLGREVSANSELKVMVFTSGTDKTLLLQLFSVESGCMLASSKARIGTGGLEGASFEAVGALVEQLVGRP